MFRMSNSFKCEWFYETLLRQLEASGCYVNPDISWGRLVFNHDLNYFNKLEVQEFWHLLRLWRILISTGVISAYDDRSEKNENRIVFFDEKPQECS